MNGIIRVLIADDSFLVRERLNSLLSSLPEIEVVGEAQNTGEVIAAVGALAPDAVVLDIQMPSGDEAALQNGIDVLRAIKSHKPAPFVVMLSNFHFAQYQAKCAEAGADAFLHKTKEFNRVPELLLSCLADKIAANGSSNGHVNGHLNGAQNGHSSGHAKMPLIKPLPREIKGIMRVPYGLRRVPEEDFATLLPCPRSVQAGDVLLTRIEKMGRNTRYELTGGRLCNLHEGDVLASVVGNRYATEQFEGYADIDGQFCDLLSMGGLCGILKSKHSSVADPTRLHVLGAIGNAAGQPLQLRNYALPAPETLARPRTIVVCGTSMDSGKTYTAFSIIFGLHTQGHKVAAYKLTGTAAGRDTWSMLDAGATPALDFIDGGYPSTYLCTVDELMALHDVLGAQSRAQGADWVIIEIADGLLQAETAALLQNERFRATVDGFVFAAGDPLAAVGGVSVLRGWGIEPLALSGRFTQSPLCIREAKAATGLPCLTARKLQRGDLNERLVDLVGGLQPNGSPEPRAIEGVFSHAL